MLENKVAIVTGASGGIGQAIAEAYLRNGARCVLVDIGAAGETLQQQLDAWPLQTRWLQADVRSNADIEATVRAAIETFGRIDILFNNAAVFDMAPLLESDEAMYERVFSVNVKGLFFMLQAVARELVAQAAGGSIINLSSQAGRRGEALVAHYCASKAAVISYTQSAALALSPHQIRVNAIAPGVIDTPMWKTVDALFARYENRPLGEKKRLVGEAVPLGRMGQPEDLTGTAVFLASDQSAYITGQTLNVDGGNVLN